MRPKGPVVHPARAQRPWNSMRKQDLRPEGPDIPFVFSLVKRNYRPFRSHQDFGGINSRAERPWLGELLARWAVGPRDNIMSVPMPNRSARPLAYYNRETSRTDGGPARRSAAGPTLPLDQAQKGADHSDREGRRDSTCDENSMLKRAFRCRSGYKYEIEVAGILGWPVLCFLKSRPTSLITNELTAAQRQKSL